MEPFDQISNIIKKRRTFKPSKLSDKKISDEIIYKLIDNARWAPTHGFTEPWYFVIFSGEKRQELANFQAELYKKYHKNNDFKESKYERLKTNPLCVSHVIAICVKAGTNEKIPLIEEIAAVSCAVQNMHLTATTLGLGAIWSSGFIAYHDDTKTFLNLSEIDRCLGFLYLGYPKEDEWPKSKRKPISEVSEWK